MENMTPAERQKFAYDLEQAGVEWPEIGEKLGGVTVTRAKELAKMYEHMKGILEQAENEWEKKLILKTNGIGVVKSLRNRELLNNPENIVKAGPQKLLQQRNINKRNLEIIASLLQECGYIKDVKKWLFEDTSRKATLCPHCGLKL